MSSDRITLRTDLSDDDSPVAGICGAVPSTDCSNCGFLNDEEDATTYLVEPKLRSELPPISYVVWWAVLTSSGTSPFAGMMRDFKVDLRSLESMPSSQLYASTSQSSPQTYASSGRKAQELEQETSCKKKSQNMSLEPSALHVVLLETRLQVEPVHMVHSCYYSVPPGHRVDL